MPRRSRAGPRTVALHKIVRCAGLVVLAAAFVALTPGVATAGSTTLFSFEDPRLDEVSGIARGIASPDVFYVQNDSGDSARFFALDARTGRVLAVYSVPGAQNHDWEDIAVAPDQQGVASVWLADIGDNDASRNEVELYRVDEPRVDLSRRDVSARTSAPDEWRLRYPSGPVDAESLAVSPHGRAYVVTKTDTGHSVAFSVPPHPDPERVQVMSPIAAITLRARPSLIPARLQVLATGASLAVDGSVFVVRTYTDAYVWRVKGGDLATALRTAPIKLALPLQPQGEGVCIVGASLVIDSEQVGAPIYEVPLPITRSSPTTRSPPAAPVPSKTVRTDRQRTQHSHVDRRVPIVFGALFVATISLLLLTIRRRRVQG